MSKRVPCPRSASSRACGTQDKGAVPANTMLICRLHHQCPSTSMCWQLAQALEHRLRHGVPKSMRRMPDERWGAYRDELVKVGAGDVCEANYVLPKFGPACYILGAVQEGAHLLLCHAMQLLQEELCLPLQSSKDTGRALPLLPCDA